MKGDFTFKAMFLLILHYLPRLDLYGGSVRTDPARFPKTHIGAIVSIACFGAGIALIALNASRLFDSAIAARNDGVSNIVSMDTEYFKFNAFITDQDSGSLIGAEDGRWDLPALMIECSANIEFYNRDARKLYKIELIDNNGIHRNLVSSDTPTPVSSAIYQKMSLTRGSVNQDLEPGFTDQQLSISMAKSLGFKELHSGQEIMKVLQNLQTGDKPFFDHKAYAYVRLLPWQMQSVKSCQLQVWLANQGQYLSMLQAGLIYDRKNLDRSIFSTLATTHSTWRPINFGKGSPYQWTETHVTLLKLASQMTRSELNAFRERVPIAKSLSDREFMDWRVEFTYLNNFMEVVSDFSCDGDINFNSQYATVTNNLPLSNTTYLELDAPPADADTDSLVDYGVGAVRVWPVPPFNVLMQLEKLFEVATVTNVEVTAEGKQTLRLSRANPIDFSQLGGKYPEDWQCKTSWYNDGNSCHCECGAPDPDCLPGLNLNVFGCPVPFSKVYTGSFCSRTGHCIKEPPLSMDLVLQVSQGCITLQYPGQLVMRGFMGTKAEFDEAAPAGCLPCPGDIEYDGKASMDSDLSWRCNTQTTGNLHRDLSPLLEKQIKSYVRQAEASRFASDAGVSTTPPPSTPAPGSEGNVSAACASFSSLWKTCMQEDLTSLFDGCYIRFLEPGMRFPTVSLANTDKPPVLVEVLLGTDVTYKGKIVMSTDPIGNLQPVVLGPSLDLPELPINRFYEIKCLLISAVNYDSTSINVILLNRRSDGSPVSFRNGVDRNFMVRVGMHQVPILDTVPSNELTGLAAREGGAGGSGTANVFFSPECSGVKNGQCMGPVTSHEGIILTLRFVRPQAIVQGRSRQVVLFDLCRGDDAPPNAVVLENFVTFTVTLPLAEAEFGPDQQDNYTLAVATVAGPPTTADDVTITVTEVSRRDAAINVETKVRARDEAGVRAIAAALGTGDEFKSNLNANLTALGLPAATAVTDPLEFVNFESNNTGPDSNNTEPTSAPVPSATRSAGGYAGPGWKEIADENLEMRDRAPLESEESASARLFGARRLLLQPPQVIDPKDPATCPAGKRNRIVTNLPLFAPDLLKSYGLLAPDDNTPDPLVTFPETEQPIVIVRSRGRVAEVRRVKSSKGNVLELDGDVEGNVFWPATVETEWDGKPHSCFPRQHSCVMPLYSMRLVRQAADYLPQDRYQNQPQSEPTESPANMDLELALFTVPMDKKSDRASGAGAVGDVQVAGGAGGVNATTTSAVPTTTPAPAGGSSSGGAPAARRQGDVEGNGAPAARRQGTQAPAQMTTPAPAAGAAGTSTAAPAKTRLPVGAAGDSLCPNMPMSAEEMNANGADISRKYTAFNWDKWQLSQGRDTEILACTDQAITLPACRELGEDAADDANNCFKAMPPTSSYSFVYNIPVNNKWEVPATFLRIMRGINLPEFDLDFSQVYNLQYSASAIQVEHDFSLSTQSGDYLDTNNFTIFNGATDFQGLGAGYEGYKQLAQLLPANHPVLRNTVVLGVDPATTLKQLKVARDATKGAAATKWPTDEREIKLILENFEPLQIEWELSSIGGRSGEQVLVMEPGYEYLLEALVLLRPIYSSDVWESTRIERWERQVVSTDAMRTKLADPEEAHKIIVRYHIEFDPLVRAQIFRKSTTVKSFAEAVGAAAGFVVLGALLLNGLRRLRPYAS